MAATLTKSALLAGLSKGNATISIVTVNPAAGVALSGLTFADADQLISLQDSFTLTPDDASETTINIDQNDAIIETFLEEGNWTLEMNVPSFATALFDYFFTKGATVASIIGANEVSYGGAGYNKPREDVYVSMLIESKALDVALALGVVKVSASYPQHDDHNGPDYVKLTGKVLDNPGGDKFAVLTKNKS